MKTDQFEQHHPDYVSITSGMRGYFAVLLRWNTYHGGFYEPWQTGEVTGRTYDDPKMLAEARAWAEDLECEFRGYGI